MTPLYYLWYCLVILDSNTCLLFFIKFEVETTRYSFRAILSIGYEFDTIFGSPQYYTISLRRINM